MFVMYRGLALTPNPHEGISVYFNYTRENPESILQKMVSVKRKIFSFSRSGVHLWKLFTIFYFVN